METGVDGDDATPMLFQSLLRALKMTHAPTDIHASIIYPVDESVQEELHSWWRMRPLSGATPVTCDFYARFYRRLVDALQQQHLLPIDRNGDSADIWIENDWHCDEKELLHAEKAISVFTTALATIAFLGISASDANNADERLAVVKKLRALCSNDNGTDLSVEEKQSTTMAEELSRMRAKPLNSTTSVAGATATPVAIADPTSLITTAIGLKGVPFSTETLSVDDDAAHYFTIETRLELRERLTTLQHRLDDLLLQTKLAWMKCFAHTSSNYDDKQMIGTDCDEAIATRLVAEGETLAFHLLEAFEKARKATCPINEYKALVATCEADFDTFQTLVNATAAAPSPVRTRPIKADPVVNTLATTSLQKPRPAAFDLPSMQTYYDRAAPSYAAYLPRKKR